MFQQASHPNNIEAESPSHKLIPTLDRTVMKWVVVEMLKQSLKQENLPFKVMQRYGQESRWIRIQK